MSRLGTRAPALTYAERADAYARLIAELVKDAIPYEIGEVANEMTKAWKAMAHMSDRVERIEISPNCEVRMIASDGADLHQIDKSAGASQVFYPSIDHGNHQGQQQDVPLRRRDTPLGPALSRDQRIGVLRTFTDRRGQVVLLSTDQEVVGDKLDAIRDRIVASHELKISHDNGIAVTTVHDLDLSTIQA